MAVNKITPGEKLPLNIMRDRFNFLIDDVNNFQTQIDQIVVDGSIDPETAQARVDSSGYAYNTLQNRLNTQFTDVNAELAQNTTDRNGRGINIMFPPSPLVGAVGDGVTDDSLAIQNILNSIDQFDHIIIPNKTFLVKTRLDIVNKRNFTVTFLGKVVADNCSGMYFEKCGNMRINNINVFSSNIDWNQELQGVQFESCYSSHIGINQINGFKYGLSITGTIGGCAYNTFDLGTIKNNQKNVYLKSDGVGGYVTENAFHKGRMTLDSDVSDGSTGVGTGKIGSYGVFTESLGSFDMNNLSFYSPSNEGLDIAMELNGFEFTVITPRFEQSNTHISGEIQRSFITFGFNGVEPSKMELSTQSRNNAFIGKHVDNETNIHAVGGDFSGYSFLNYGDLSTLAQIKYQVGVGSVTITDSSNELQRMNKQFEGGSIPTSGTYRNGAIVWNNTPVTGEPMGWICSGLGTSGTLSGVTGSATNGSRSVTVNTTDGLYVGAWVTIGTDNKYIDQISGNVINLSGALTADYTDEPISYYNPTFIPLANIP